MCGPTGHREGYGAVCGPTGHREGYGADQVVGPFKRAELEGGLENSFGPRLEPVTGFGPFRFGPFRLIAIHRNE